jgi:hypothetical protein
MFLNPAMYRKQLEVSCTIYKNKDAKVNYLETTAKTWVNIMLDCLSQLKKNTVAYYNGIPIEKNDIKTMQELMSVAVYYKNNLLGAK